MDYTLNIVSLRSQDELFSQILADPAFSAIEAHPQSGRYGRTYYPAYWGGLYREFSFVVMWQDNPILVILCGTADDVLGFHGMPIHIFCRADIVDRHVLTLAAEQAFAWINQIAVDAKVQDIRVRDELSPALSPIGEVALEYDATTSIAVTGMVDLTAGPAVWKHALRKSFRQFVNWGRTNLTIEYVNRASPSLDNFDAYREFHARIAGRVTRPKASWDIQFAEISRGRGELILGHLDGNLVAGSLFIDGTEVTLYMNGVYDRALDKPLAHYMIWHGIERAHGRGMKSLQLGDIHLPDAVDDKRYSVGYFKRGFATHFNTSVVWQWHPKGSAGNTEITAEQDSLSTQ